MKILFPFALLLCASAAQAVPVPATAPTTAKPQPPVAAKRFPGVSDEGNAILAKAQAAADPQLQTIGKQAKAAHDQLVSAVMAPVIDLDKVTAAMRAEEAVQGQLRTHNNDRLLAVLKQMSADDRGTFLRTLILSRAPRTANAQATVPPIAPSTPQP